MASSKPQGYYICLLKALRETSSPIQSLVGAWMKVAKLILIWLTVVSTTPRGTFLFFAPAKLTTATRVIFLHPQLLWLKGCKTDESTGEPEDWENELERETLLQTVEARRTIKHTGGFDQWPRLKGNGFRIITTLFIIGWVSVRLLTPPLSFPVEKWWSIWSDAYPFTHILK